MGIEELRGRIDSLDAEILRLLAERLEIARQVGEEKRGLGISPYDPVRERELTERLVGQAKGRIPASALRAVYREIISASRALESERSVLYLGSPASLAHQAARERFGESASFVATESAERIFEQIDSGASEFAVLTLEAASLESHLDRLDLFLQSRAQIFGEFYVVPRIGLYAAGEGEPQTVYGHPAALVSCSRWIQREGGRTRILAAGTPQEAAERALREGAGELGYGVLAGTGGLALREDGLQDEPRTFRRFLIMGSRDGTPSGRDKTSLVAVIPNRAAALHEVTGVLARRRVNLAWIEPKATTLGTWDHIFFLDLEGHRSDPTVAAAIEELRACTEWLKVLGSYPSERPPGRSIG